MLRVLAFSLHRPIVLLTLAAAFAVAGAFAFWHLPIEAFPELADPQVQVITLFPGHAAEEVERQVTLPVEHEMNGLPGLTRMHSSPSSDSRSSCSPSTMAPTSTSRASR